MNRFLFTATSALLVVGLAGCGQSPTPGPTSSTIGGNTQITVVASTNVYGSIASTIGGDQVTVTSLMDDPAKDPHEYEADAQNQLALSKAQVVIENGAGYDDFVQTMLQARPAKGTVINVADLSGYDQTPAQGEFNEHLWYDFPTMAKLADRLVTDLSAANPAAADTFETNAATFTTKLKALESAEARIEQSHAGEGVAITEPVPLYLLDAAGFDNLTPVDFSEAIEEDTDVSPAVLKQTVDLFDTHAVTLLAYNEQTTGPQTEAVLAAARRNDIAVVSFTETLPAGQDYLSWMQANVDTVSTALAP